MGFLAKLYVNDSEKAINILRYHLSGSKNANPNGYPSAAVVLGPLNLIFEALPGADLFFRALVNQQMVRKLKLVIPSRTGTGKSTIYIFYDFYVTAHREIFDAINNQPMKTYVTVSYATIIANGVLINQKYWKVTDPNENTKPTVIENDDEEVIDCYLTDLENNENPDLEIEKEVYLVVKTENMVGQTKDIDLSNFGKIFAYNGETLEENTLSDFDINSETQKVKLTVVKDQKEDNSLL